MVVMGVIMGLLLPLVLGSRDALRGDQRRTGVNQALRIPSEIIGNDIRMAGERFARLGNTGLQPVQIVPGGTGASDEIILRRNRSDEVLPVCETVQGSQNSFRIYRQQGWLNSPQGAPYPECGPVMDPDGWPRNLRAVHDLAAATTTDGVLRGFLYNPSAGTGQFFDFRVRTPPTVTSGQILREGTPFAWDGYPLANRPRVYILEERRYRLRDGFVELIVNGRDQDPLRVAAGIEDLRFRYVLDDDQVTSIMPEGMGWRNIRSVEVLMTASYAEGADVTERTLAYRYFPRNILSR